MDKEYIELPKTNHIHINRMIEKYEAEVQPFRKVHRLIDLIEVIIKTHTAYIFGTYFKHTKVSEDIKSILASGLKTPSLGIWQMFSREIIYDILFPTELTKEQFENINNTISQKEIKDIFNNFYIRDEDSYSFFLFDVEKRNKLKNIFLNEKIKMLQLNFSIYQNDYYKYFFEVDNKYISNGKNLIAFRNSYAHGATPSDTECDNHILKYQDDVKYLLECNIFKTYEIIFKNRHVYMKNLVTSEEIDLFPILLDEFSAEEEICEVIFFNDLKKWDSDRVSFLNYPEAKHVHDMLIYHEFKSVIDYDTWRYRICKDQFQAMIDQLTEVFKGRIDEIGILKKFIYENSKNMYMIIRGAPGIGKSALLASLIKGIENNNISLAENSETKKDNITVFRWFFKRSYVDSVEKFLLQTIRKIEESFGFINRVVIDGREINNSKDVLMSYISQLSEHLQNEKVLFIIDGLDELLSSPMDDNAKSLFANLVSSTIYYKNVKVIYSSRSNWEKVEAFYRTVPELYKTNIVLGKLAESDIRAILYEVVGKYDVIKMNEVIIQIIQVSGGNPLYINLMCKEIESGKLEFNKDILAMLPEKIDGFYERLLERVKKIEDNDVSDTALNLLYTIAAAKDYVDDNLLSLMMNFSNDAIIKKAKQYIGDYLTDGSNEKAYQFFHESIREHLKNDDNMKKKVISAEKNIVDYYCSKWNDNELLDDEIEYAMRHYAEHLASLANHYSRGGYDTKLYEIAMNKEYQALQNQITKGNTKTRDMLIETVNFFSSKNVIDKVIELAARMLEFYKEAGEVNYGLTLDEIENMVIEVYIENVNLLPIEKRQAQHLLLLLKISECCEITEKKRKIADRVSEEMELIFNCFYKGNVIIQLIEILYERACINFSIKFNIYLPIIDKCLVNFINLYVSSCGLKNGNTILSNIKDEKTKKIILSKMINIGMKLDCEFSMLIKLAENIKDETDKVHAYISIVLNKAEEAGLEELLKLAEKMTDFEARSAIYKVICEKKAETGIGLEKLVEVAAKIDDSRNRSAAYRAIFEKKAGGGATLEELVDVAENIVSSRDRSVAFMIIFEKKIEGGAGLEELIGVAERIVGCWERSVAFRVIFEKKAEVGVEFEVLVKFAENIVDAWERSAAYRAICEKKAEGKIGLEELVKIAEKISDPEERSEAYKVICENKAGGESGIEELLGVAAKIVGSRERSSTYRVIFEKQSEGGAELSELVRFAENIVNSLERSAAYRAICEKKAKGKTGLDELAGLAEKISDPEERSETYKVIFQKKAEIGICLEELKEVASKIVGSLERSVAFRTICEKKADGGLELVKFAENKVDPLERLSSYREIFQKKAEGGAGLEELVELAEKISNVEERSGAYRVICEKREEGIEALVGVVDKIGYTWRKSAYRVIFEKKAEGRVGLADLESFAEKINDPEERSVAFRVIFKKKVEGGAGLKELVEAAAKIDNIRTRLAAYRVIFNKKSSGVELGELVEIAENIVGSRERSISYREILKKKSEGGLGLQELIGVAEQIVDSRKRSSAYTAIFAKEVEGEIGIEELVNVADKIGDSLERSKAYSTICKKKAGRVGLEELVKVADKIGDPLERLKAYSTICEKKAAGEVRLEVRLEELVEAASKINYTWDRVAAYRAIFERKAEGGTGLEELVEAASKINDTRDRDAAYRAIFERKAEGGIGLAELVEAGSKINDTVDRSAAYSVICKKKVEEASLRELVGVAEKMEDSWDRSATYIVICEKKAEGGTELEELVEAASKINDTGARSETYRVICEKKAEGGTKLEELVKVTANIEDSWNRAAAYRAIFEKKAEGGTSLELLAEAAVMIDNIEDRSEVYSIIYEKKAEKAELPELVEAAMKIDFIWDRSEVYRSICKKKVVEASLKELVGVAEKIDDYEEVSEVYRTIFEKKAESGVGLKELVEVAEEISDFEIRSAIYKLICEKKVEGGTALEELVEVAAKINDSKDRLSTYRVIFEKKAAAGTGLVELIKVAENIYYEPCRANAYMSIFRHMPKNHIEYDILEKLVKECFMLKDNSDMIESLSSIIRSQETNGDLVKIINSFTNNIYETNSFFIDYYFNDANKENNIPYNTYKEHLIWLIPKVASTTNQLDKVLEGMYIKALKNNDKKTQLFLQKNLF